MARVPAAAKPARKPRTPRTAPAAAPEETAVIAPERIHALRSAGWMPSADGTLWFHQRRSRGEFYSLDQAEAAQALTSQAQDYAPDVDPTQLGVDVASPEAAFPAEVLGAPEHNPLVYEEGPETGTGREVQRPPEPDPATFRTHANPDPATPTSAYGTPLVHETAEQAAQRADAEAREAAINRNEPGAVEFAHDQVGDVTFWTCYHCNTQVRYAPHCLCPRCQAIRAEANSTKRCPFCNHPNPQGD